MQLVRIIRKAVEGWWDDRCLRMGAALSFYTTFSLAPVLLIANVVAGFAFGDDVVRKAIITEFEGLVGADPAAALDTMLSQVGHFGSGLVATATGVAFFLVLATGAITELQDDLHEIFGVVPDRPPLTVMVRSRLVSLALVVTIGFLLLVSLAVSAGVTAVTDRAGAELQALAWLVAAANTVVSVVAATALFTAIFKILPEVEIPWRDAIFGSFLAALLFQLGKFAIGFYIGRTSIPSAYGAAGSLVTILLWIYYSSQILLFAAEFTKHYGEARREAAAG